MIWRPRSAISSLLVAMLMGASAPAWAQHEPSAPRSAVDETGPTSGAAEPTAGETSDEPAGEPTEEDETSADLDTVPVASEQDDASNAGVPDWRAAATPEQQKAARRLFLEGNDRVKESLFVQAVDQYEAALTHWDHPGIHYNLALALINLDQPVRLRAHLIEALKYGDGALGADKARRAKQYITLVEKQLTELTIRSNHPGARIELDGKLLFVAPGEYHDFVRPGQHTVRATATGYETTERSLSLVAGERTELPLRLYKSEDWIQNERRWKGWGPITTTASGAAVLGLGFALYAVGSKQVRDFDAKVEERCGAGGCAAGELDDSASRGENLQGFGIGTIALGGVTLATGGILLYLNRPIPHRVDPDAGDSVSFAPVLGPNMVGLTGRGVF